ncbi:conserved hypothetical protein [Gammaproteobacteria bacterium]
MNIDHDQWLKRTVTLVRAKQWQAIDSESLAEELEALGKSERRSIESQLVRLLVHLLKWQYQPQRRSDSWLDSISDARLQIDLTLQDSSSLKGYPAEQLSKTYLKARQGASQQTGLPLHSFPETCQYTLEKMLDEGWLP